MNIVQFLYKMKTEAQQKNNLIFADVWGVEYSDSEMNAATDE